MHEWGSTGWGRRLTTTPVWRITLEEQGLTLRVGAQVRVIRFDELRAFETVPGFFWATVVIHSVGAARLTLDGIPNDQAARMLAAVRAGERRASLTRLEAELKIIFAWAERCWSWRQARRWITLETVRTLESARPTGGEAAELERRLRAPESQPLIAAQSEQVRAAVTLWLSDLRAVTETWNAAYWEQERFAGHDWFVSQESQASKAVPLTEEQARAVVCFDNRVQVVAAAGSGKTALLVAKAAYAVGRELVRPERILLLAFNRKAAEQLQTRLAAMKCSAALIETRTFHSFGLSLMPPPAEAGGFSGIGHRTSSTEIGTPIRH